MKLVLKNGVVTIVPRTVPEPIHRVFLQYEFEFNKNHLSPVLTIGKDTFTGNNITIDMDRTLSGLRSGDDTDIVVKLVNADGVAVATYRGNVPYYKYCLLGVKRIRPDFEEYIAELEATIEKLRDEGEVI